MNLIDNRQWQRLWALALLRIIGLYFRNTRGIHLKLYEAGVYLIQKSNIIIANI